MKEINGGEELNYTHVVSTERMFFTTTGEELSGNPEIISGMNYCDLTFQFLKVLLKSITDPFIFSKVTDVEKMEIQ